MGFLGFAGAAGALFLLAAYGDELLSDDDAQYAAVCMDQRTDVRLDDDQCGDWDDDGVGHVPGTYFLWLPMSADDAYVPPVGGYLQAGSPAVRVVPKGTPVATGASKAGGSVSAVKRGGLGSTSAGGSKSGTAGKSGGS